MSDVTLADAKAHLSSGSVHAAGRRDAGRSIRGAGLLSKGGRFRRSAGLNLRAGDVLHLALCADVGSKLCTLDRRLSEAAPQVGVETLLL